MTPEREKMIRDLWEANTYPFPVGSPYLVLEEPRPRLRPVYNDDPTKPYVHPRVCYERKVERIDGDAVIRRFVECEGVCVAEIFEPAKRQKARR